MSEEIKKAIGFCRVATATQVDQVEKLQIQKQQIVKAARYLNVEIVQFFEQVGNDKQVFPYSSLDEVLSYCKSNPAIKILIVTETGRISRSLEQFHYWKVAFERIGVTIQLTDESKPTSSIEDSIIEDAYLCMVADHEHEVRLAEIEEAVRGEKAKKV
jgi:DNA invertase Pin-like site-specific DNA recombinase